MLKKVIIANSAYVLAYLSVAGYFLAYKYKEGYFIYFNIPSVYMNTIDFIDIIKMISAIVAFFSFGIYIIINPRRKGGGNSWLDRIDKNSLPLLIFTLILGFFDITVIRWISLIAILLILIHNLVLPLFFCREVKGYNNKIATFFNGHEHNNIDFIATIENKIKHQFFSLIITIIILTYAFGGVVYLVGNQNAKDTYLYNVSEIEGIKHIVFNVGGDKVIASALNNKKLSREFSLHSKKEILIMKEEIQGLEVD